MKDLLDSLGNQGINWRWQHRNQVKGTWDFETAIGRDYKQIAVQPQQSIMGAL